MVDTSQWFNSISALFGAWLFASAFVFGMGGAQFWNSLIIGAAIALLAGYGAYRTRETGMGNTWTSGLAGLLGVWMIAAPFVYGAATTVMASSVISGLVVAVLSGYEAYEARMEARAATTEGPRA
ncbi:hypothetical protein C499_09162 [Halogeometricum borinquense DSM 11551]|uniref:SPW repeat protein n=2 Tax=Halogeometricum borinquense TaxID=60847 RepID=E4NN52_HALBP|nr:SPW repeat protein [Halogeometricum borinquense]ADQ66282.1 SPW repeat protein [Halogeometricum borinquense DSM 11551]ELY27728.1 hypothetical protein C499_09162 [Halogeometricum borinquense DSM 11551]RYJ14694.1 hypothetical protein ELS19_12530 [Halogeometricum borinquense]